MHKRTKTEQRLELHKEHQRKGKNLHKRARMEVCSSSRESGNAVQTCRQKCASKAVLKYVEVLVVCGICPVKTPRDTPKQ
eukprot:975804-Amphidinium_carterae.1